MKRVLSIFGKLSTTGKVTVTVVVILLAIAIFIAMYDYGTPVAIGAASSPVGLLLSLFGISKARGGPGGCSPSVAEENARRAVEMAGTARRKAEESGSIAVRSFASDLEKAAKSASSDRDLGSALRALCRERGDSED